MDFWYNTIQIFIKYGISNYVYIYLPCGYNQEQFKLYKCFQRPNKIDSERTYASDGLMGRTLLLYKFKFV